MPLTDFQRKRVLLDHGFDPEAFDLDENTGSVYKKEQAAPLEVQTPVPSSSATKAFLTSAKSAIGPVAGGIGAIAAATPTINAPLAAFGTAAAPATLGASYLPLLGATLIEGALGALAGGKAQQYLEPKIRGEAAPETTQRLRQEEQLRQEHPVASFLGEFAPQLAVARPSPKMIGQGVGGITRLLTGAAKARGVTPLESRAIQNLGFGGALGLGSEAANQAFGEQPFSIPRLAGSTALGALISHPYNNTLNRALKIAPGEEAPRPEAGELSDILQSGKPLPEIVDRLERMRASKNISPDYKKIIEENLLPALKTKQTEVATEKGIETKAVDIVQPQKSAKETAEVFKKTGVLERERLESELGKLAIERGELSPTDIQTRIGELEKEARESKYGQQLESLNKQLETIRAENEMLRLQQQSKRATAEQEILSKVTETGVEERKPVTTPRIRGQIKDLNFKAYVKARQSGDKAAADFYAKESPEFIEKYEKGDFTPFEPVTKEGPTKTYFQGEKAGLEKPGEFQTEKESIQKGLEEKGVSTTPTTGLLSFFRKLGKIRNYRVKLDNTLERPVYDKEGNLTGYESVKGAALPRQELETALTKINPRTASIDTLGHEGLHIFKSALKNSPSKIDRDIAYRFDKMVSELPEFQAQKAKDPGLTPDEFSIETTGYDVIRRLFNTDKTGGTWRGWLNDFLSDIKVKWNRASPKDYARLLSNRFLTDRPFSETFKGETPPPKPTIVEEKTEQETTPTEEPNYAPEIKTTTETPSNEPVAEQTGKPTIGEGERNIEETGRPTRPSGEEAGTEEAKRSETITPQFQGEEAGLKPTSSQEELLNKYKEVLSSRKPYQETKVSNIVEANTLLGKKRVAGKYNYEKDVIHSIPDSKITALHEAIHQINRRNENLLRSIIKNAPEEDVLNVKNILSKVHPIYEANLKNADAFRIIDEGLASLAGPQDTMTTELKSRLANSITNIIGEDNVDFLVKGSKEETYYPKFKRHAHTEENIKRILESQEKTIKDFDDKYQIPEKPGVYENATPEDIAKLAIQIEGNLREITRLKEADPGFYYQRIAQGLDEKTINFNRELVRRGKDFQGEGVLKTAIRDLLSGRLPITGSDIDKFEVRSGYIGKKLAPALREFFAVERSNQGKYLFPTLEALNKLNDTSIDKLETIMLMEKRLQESFRSKLNVNEQKAYDKVREVLKLKQEEQIKVGQPVVQFNKDGTTTYRLPKVDPFYVPEVVGRKQLDILLNKPESPAANLLKEDFIKLYVEKYDFTEKAAQSLLEDILGSYGGALRSDSTHFNAVRKAEGIGLPDTWKEHDFKRALERYWRRVSKDRAFFDTIEKDPNLATIIGQKYDAFGKPLQVTDPKVYPATGNDTLNSIMNVVQGRPVKINPRLDALSRIANGIILGPLTGINDFISGPGLIAKFIPSVGHIPGFIKAMTDIRTGISHAQETGFVKQKISDYQDLFNSSTEFVDKLTSIANNITKFTGRDGIEKWSRGLTQSLAEYLIGVHQKLASSGDIKSQKLLSGLSKNYKNLSVKELGTRLGELTQGTYDPRGLPGFILDSPLAPFLRLSKWGIEQSNNFFKHAILPAKEGNFAPLMYSLFGASIGGYVIKEIRERLTGKKLQIPSLNEIAASERGFKGNVPAEVYNFAAAASYAGTFGVVGDIMKSLIDIYHKNSPQGFNYPLAEIIADSSTKIGHAAQAIIDGENPASVAPALLSDLLKDNTQVWRLALNNYNRVVGDQRFKDAAARRDLRVFKMVEGLPYSPQGAGDDNPYENLEVKKFKQTSDIKEASTLLPDVIQDAIKKAKGDPDRLKELLRGLKINSLQTLPSPESKPREFIKYRRYLDQTIGATEASERTKNYLIRRELNKVKSSLVP